MKTLSKLVCTFMFIFCLKAHSFDYINWWQNWYASGGTSGSGSYGILAEFKAEVINHFIESGDRNINTVIEFGCGDGNNLRLMKFKQYIGLDVSVTAIEKCKNLFIADKSKHFMVYNPRDFVNTGSFKCDLAICLDVLYHITDEKDFIKTLDDIFSCSPSYVILYTTLHQYSSIPNSGIVHRDLFPYLKKYSGYDFTIIEQKYRELSAADFVILTKKNLFS